jgi:hypothetical protein
VSGRAWAAYHAPTDTIARVVWRGQYTFGRRDERVELVRDRKRRQTQVWTSTRISLAHTGRLLIAATATLDLTHGARQSLRQLPIASTDFEAVLHPDGDRLVGFRTRGEPRGLYEVRWDGRQTALWTPAFTPWDRVPGARGVAVFDAAPDGSAELYEFLNRPDVSVAEDGVTWSIATQDRQIVVRDGEELCNVCWGWPSSYYLHYAVFDGDRVLRAGHAGMFALDLEGNVLARFQTDRERRPVVSTPVRVGRDLFAVLRTESWNNSSGYQHRAYEIWRFAEDSLKPIAAVGSIPAFYCEHDETVLLPMPDGSLVFSARQGDVRRF